MIEQILYNPIGIIHTPFKTTEGMPVQASRAKGKKVSANILQIEDVDMLDGTPLLDIKPYTPEFDSRDNVQTGWLANAKSKNVKSDKRFI